MSCWWIGLIVLVGMAVFGHTCQWLESKWRERKERKLGGNAGAIADLEPGEYPSAGAVQEWKECPHCGETIPVPTPPQAGLPPEGSVPMRVIRSFQFSCPECGRTIQGMTERKTVAVAETDSAPGADTAAFGDTNAAALPRDEQESLLKKMVDDPAQKERLMAYVRELVDIAQFAGFLHSGATGGFDEDGRNVRARQIGEELNRLGGKRLMQEVCLAVGQSLPANAGQLGMGSRRELESAWHGIGQWRG